jgi:hypothetical protein
MITRVQKKFLNKIYPPFAIMAYVFIIMEIFIRAENIYVAGAIVGVGIIGPLLIWFFREAWRDAKWEVERENQIMMNTLKDS